MSRLSNRLGSGGAVTIRAKLHEVGGERGRTWFFSYNLRGQRVRSGRFKDREVAQFEMRKIVDQYEAQTPYQATTLSREQIDDAQGAFIALQKNGVAKPLCEIVSWFIEKGPRCEPITMGQAIERFLLTLNPVEKRAGTIRFYEHTLSHLKMAFETRQLSEITTEEFRKFIDRPEWGQIARWHHRQVANRIYRWAIKQTPKLASENPVESLPRMTKKGLRKVLSNPKVMPPTLAKAWLNAAKSTPHLPFVVMALFAGMRRTEIREFAALPEGGWAQISFETGTIEVPPGVGKTGKRTIEMHPTLKAWLLWLKKHQVTDFAAPNLNKGLRAIKKEAANVEGAILGNVPNLARHSFISYSLRLTGVSFARVAMNAGNTEQVIKDHYNDLQVTSKQAMDFWRLTPKVLKC